GRPAGARRRGAPLPAAGDRPVLDRDDPGSVPGHGAFARHLGGRCRRPGAPRSARPLAGYGTESAANPPRRAIRTLDGAEGRDYRAGEAPQHVSANPNRVSKDRNRPGEFRRYRQLLTALYLGTAGAGF